MGNGIAISYYMMQGKFDGCIKCSMRYNSAVAYKIPYVVVRDCKDMDALNGAGIYMLFGESPKEKKLIYIGQASSRKNGNGLRQRMLEKHDTIEEWSEAIILTTSDGKMGATELGYIEHVIYKMATEANVCKVANKNEPSKGKITEEEESDLKNYIRQAEILLRALSCKELESTELKSESVEVFSLKGTGFDAKAFYTPNGFVVQSGSKINPTVSEKCPNGVRAARDRYEDMIENDIIKTPITFRSPSAAASFVCGYSVNGQKYWKTADGQILKNYDASRVK